MSQTPQVASMDECHSFVPEQSTKKGDAPKRIPRPPNAFMLYRSEFLKRQTVPPEVEKRQENLSRIAGQCWNMLPETEKAIWFSKAAAIRAKHCISHQTRPFRKDTRKLLAKGKTKESTTNSWCSLDQYGTYRQRTRHCKEMFVALNNSKFPLPELRASFNSPGPASRSSLPAIPSHSPLLFPYPLPPFTSHTRSSGQDLSHETSMIPRSNPSHLLQWGLVSGSEIPSSEIGSSRRLQLTLQQHEYNYLPFPGLEHPPRSDLDVQAQVRLTSSGSGVPSFDGHELVDFCLLMNDFNFIDDLALAP